MRVWLTAILHRSTVCLHSQLYLPRVIKLWCNCGWCCCRLCCRLRPCLRPHPHQALPQLQGVCLGLCGLDAAHGAGVAGLWNVCKQGDVRTCTSAAERNTRCIQCHERHVTGFAAAPIKNRPNPPCIVSATCTTSHPTCALAVCRKGPAVVAARKAASGGINTPLRQGSSPAASVERQACR